MRINELAKRLGGRLLGEDGEVRAVCSLGTAGANDVAALLHPKELPEALRTRAGCLLLSESYAAEYGHRAACGAMIVLANPFVGFARAMDLLHPPSESAMQGVHPSCVIHESAELGEGVRAGPLCCIGNARIGAHTHVSPFAFVDDDVHVGQRCVLGAGCTVLRGSRIADDVIVHPGAVVGSDGFVYAPDGGTSHKVACPRGVIIDQAAEVGAGACIDRGLLEHTRLEQGVKIDNLVQIAHDVSVGHDTVIAAQSGVAGHSRLGSRVLLGGQAGVRERVNVGEDACVSAQAGVARDVPRGQSVAGSPAMPQIKFLRGSSLFRRLSHLAQEVKRLSDKVDALSES
ncbi:MAG: UDP-3-O-(3-hydroxymyristoyl)glucosamine N-acyltransferase [Myxococcota bacterium]